MKTMSMTWVAERPGNWIFHCHFASHMASSAAWESDRSDMTPHAAHAGSMLDHLSGLVLGMTVRARGEVMQAGAVARSMRLLVRSKARQYGDNLGYSFVLGGSPEEADRDAMPVPGPLLELTRGERVAITIVNQSHDQAAIHWHGIELESLPDGVAGWSGAGSSMLPMIAPGDSLTVRFTPPRAGTFMYHSHSNEMQQISSGLYGVLIVSEPGVPRDLAHDRVLVISDGGPVIDFLDPNQFPRPLLNGARTPAPIELTSDRPTRLRRVNLRTELAMQADLLDHGVPVQWRLVAKDGMERPDHQRALRPARLRIAPGEIYDVEIAATSGTAMELRYDLVDPPEVRASGGSGSAHAMTGTESALARDGVLRAPDRRIRTDVSSRSFPDPEQLMRLALTVLTLALPASLSAQAAASSAAQQGSAAGRHVELPEATEFVANFTEALSSKTSTEGDAVKLRVDEAVVIRGDTVIRQGSIVRGTITEAKGAGFMGKGGKLNMRLESVTLADGQHAKVRSAKSRGGDEKRGQTVALTVLFGPLGLLRRGNDAEIKAGTPLTLFTDEAITLVLRP